MTAIDWHAYPWPWSERGPGFAQEAAEIAADPTIMPPKVYVCEDCGWETTHSGAMNGHRTKHWVWGK